MHHRNSATCLALRWLVTCSGDCDQSTATSCGGRNCSPQWHSHSALMIRTRPNPLHLDCLLLNTFGIQLSAPQPPGRANVSGPFGASTTKTLKLAKVGQKIGQSRSQPLDLPVWNHFIGDEASNDIYAFVFLLPRYPARMKIEDFTANIHGNLKQKGYTRKNCGQMFFRMLRAGGLSCQCTCWCRNRVRANQTRKHCTGAAAGKTLCSGGRRHQRRRLHARLGRSGGGSKGSTVRCT